MRRKRSSKSVSNVKEYEKGYSDGMKAAFEDSELDACIFDRVNTDGCCIGVYFAPRAAYYPHFRHCVMADNPSYGFFADGTQAKAR